MDISHRALRNGALAIGMTLVAPLATLATLSPFRACFDLPVLGAVPTIDGNIRDDSGWNTVGFGPGSWKYEFGSATSIPHASVRVLRDASNLYLGFEVNHDPTFDSSDVIVLTFDPGGENNRRRLHIFPEVVDAGVIKNPRVEYSKWTPGGWGSAVINPPWLDSKVSSVSGGAWNSWTVEVRIPVTATADDPGINVPASGDFGLYFNIIRIDDPPESSAVALPELYWPPSASGIIGGPILFLDTGTPAPENWGNGTRGGVACNGVAILPEDITVYHPPSASPNSPSDVEIDLNGPNVFRATPRNTSINASGASVPAENVIATFKIRNEGVGVNWAPLPSPADVPPVDDIPAASGATPGSATLSSPEWTLNSTQRGDYAAHRHQCIRVELTSKCNPDMSTPDPHDCDPAQLYPDTTFINDSAAQNMDFVGTASPFSRTWSISSKGFELPEGQSEQEFLLSELTYNTPRNQKWSSRHPGLEPIGPNQYRLRMAPEADLDIASTIIPPEIHIPVETYRVPLGTGGRLPTLQIASGREPLRIPVRPGNLLTLIAEGGARSALSEVPCESSTTAGSLQLSASAPLGSLLGSFDRFASSFAIADSISLRVPKEAQELQIAINDFAGLFDRQRGPGFHLQVTQTPPSDDFFSAVPEGGRLPMGANLPTWMMCGYRKTGRKLEIRGTLYDMTEDAGCFGYIVKSIGRQDSPFSLSLHGGRSDPRSATGEMNDPRGVTSRSFEGGSSFGFDLEYAINPTFALELYAGHDEFDGIGRTRDVALDQISLSGKAYFLTGLVRPYLVGGVGLYDFQPGPRENGTSYGAGLQLNLWPKAALELSGRLHTVNTSPDDFEFTSYQAVVRFRP